MTLPDLHTWARMSQEDRIEAVLRWFEPPPAPDDLLALRREALRRAALEQRLPREATDGLRR